jgi:hypothetical protein
MGRRMKLLPEELKWHAEQYIVKYRKEGWCEWKIYEKVKQAMSRVVRGRKRDELMKHVLERLGL